jgi:hypothetical protein
MSSGLELGPLTAPPDLEGLDQEERVAAMRDWFFDNFEDPAEHTPHDSGEGGYQYIWGGPYDALDEIGSAFPDAEQQDIDEAVEQVQAVGTYDWAPTDGRIQLDDIDASDGPLGNVPLAERLEALGGQLDRVEGHVRRLLELCAREEDATPGIGHNRPPPDELDDLDLTGVQASIDEVRGELAKSNAEDDADPAVLDRAETRFSRFLGWIMRQVREAPSNLVKGAVTAAGGLMFTYVAAHHQEIVASLEPAIATVRTWASVVGSSF